MRVGFYTTRIVNAVDSIAAGKLAVARLRSESIIQNSFLNDPASLPVISIDEIEEVQIAEAERVADSGYTFYPE